MGAVSMTARSQPLDFARDEPLGFARDEPLGFARGERGRSTEIASAKVLLTLIGGEPAYEGEGLPKPMGP